MRRHSSSYSVAYAFRELKFNNVACFSGLFSEIIRNPIKPNEVLCISNIMCRETNKYLENYTKKLCNIFNLTYELNKNENFVKIKGFKTCVSVKVFVTLYRMLWEHYQLDLKDSIIQFVKDFSEHKDKRSIRLLCKLYDELKVYQGGGHGLRSKMFRNNGEDKIRQYSSKKEFHESLVKFKTVHEVFNLN